MSKKILIVDDEQAVLQSLDVLLTTEGYEVVAFRNGCQATEIIKNEPFDLLITDIRMTPVNGIELIRLARQRTPPVPCIVISAYNSDEAVQECYNSGCRSFFPKPFNVNKVVAAVQQILS